MALDTAAKRRSALNVSSPWRSILPAPDGSLSLGDRQTVALLYSGIEAATSIIAVVNICLDAHICTALEFTADICTALAFDAPICCGLDLTANVGGLC